jgi:23S rRNA (uracil747-C5)-methyltransferase
MTLSEKRAHLESLFPEHRNTIKRTVGVTSADGSRSKAKLAVFNSNANGDSQLRFGFYDSAGNARDLEECPLHDSRINSFLPTLKDFIIQCKIAPYDLSLKKGELKLVLLSISNTGDLLVRFVLRSKESLDRIRMHTPDLQLKYPAVKVVTANIQPLHAAILEGDEEIILSEQKVIWHEFDEFKLALGARSFFQVTPEIAKKLYGTLSEKISNDKPQNMIDLYCGVGAFSFYSSRFCQNITGVEISKEAIDCAILSNEKNAKNISFQALDVEDYLKTVTTHFEAVLVNPPRRGLNSKIIECIKKDNPKFIYYSSCNAETMKRDFLELQDQYDISEMTIFDMFPFTEHYETLMCLVKK